MKRWLYVAVLGTALLAPSASASSPRGSAVKAGKYLAKVIRAADTTAFSTGRVRVTGCRAQRSGPRGRSFVCRVAVQRIYPDGASRVCSDKVGQRALREAQVPPREAQLLQPGRIHMRHADRSGRRARSAPPHDSPAPIVDLPPAPTGPPVIGPPPGAPPFPFPFASQASRAAKAPTAGAAQARSYASSDGFPTTSTRSTPASPGPSRNGPTRRSSATSTPTTTSIGGGGTTA